VAYLWPLFILFFWVIILQRIGKHYIELNINILLYILHIYVLKINILPFYFWYIKIDSKTVRISTEHCYPRHWSQRQALWSFNLKNNTFQIASYLTNKINESTRVTWRCFICLYWYIRAARCFNGDISHAHYGYARVWLLARSVCCFLFLCSSDNAFLRYRWSRSRYSLSFREG